MQTSSNQNNLRINNALHSKIHKADSENIFGYIFLIYSLSQISEWEQNKSNMHSEETDTFQHASMKARDSFNEYL